MWVDVLRRSLEKEGEWACRGASLAEGLKLVLLFILEMHRSEFDPLWVVAEVVVVFLMAEEHVLITPHRSLKS